MKTAKQITKAVLGIVCIVSIILAGAENPDGSCNLAWTLSFLGVALLSGVGLKRMEDAK